MSQGLSQLHILWAAPRPRCPNNCQSQICKLYRGNTKIVSAHVMHVGRKNFIPRKTFLSISPYTTIHSSVNSMAVYWLSEKLMASPTVTAHANNSPHPRIWNTWKPTSGPAHTLCPLIQSLKVLISQCPLLLHLKIPLPHLMHPCQSFNCVLSNQPW